MLDLKKWIAKVTDSIASLTARQDIKMAAGYESVGQINANAYKDVTLSYSFSSTPRVVATIFSSGTAVNLGDVTCTVHDVTATSAKVRIFNNRSSTLSPGIEWIAVVV